MKLTELLAGVGTEPVASTRAKADITGLSADSRQVKPGDLFIAVPGTKADGTQYAHEAVQRGAVAVLAEKTNSVRPAKALPNWNRIQQSTSMGR